MTTEETELSRYVSEEQLRERLAGTFSSTKIDELIDKYVEAAADEMPDMDKINRLANKITESKLLRVSFNLEPDQYDLLAEYFHAKGRPGTQMAKDALEEFLRQMS